jgi:KEOPS complex subunit Pcc1
MSLLWTPHTSKTTTHYNQTTQDRINQNSNRLNVKLTTEFNFELTNAHIIYKSILPELENQTRSRIELHHTDASLKILIHAEDITALRAALNSWLRLIKIAYDLSNPIF